MTNPSDSKFLELAKLVEAKQEELNKLQEELNTAMVALGLNYLLQCPLTLTVYKIVKPKGTYTPFREIDYVRTALEGERAGGLSKKEAELAGFTVLKKS